MLKSPIVINTHFGGDSVRFYKDLIFFLKVPFANFSMRQ